MDAKKSKTNQNHWIITSFTGLRFMAFYTIIMLWYPDVFYSAHGHWKFDNYINATKKSEQQNYFITFCNYRIIRILLQLIVPNHAGKSKILNTI